MRETGSLGGPRTGETTLPRKGFLSVPSREYRKSIDFLQWNGLSLWYCREIYS